MYETHSEEAAPLDATRFTTKIDLAVETLRRAIISGDLLPGNRLRQEELAHRFGISATPIREALRRLQAEGLVVTEPHKGTSVASFDAERTREIYMIRGELEGLAARLAAARMTPAVLRRLEQEQNRLRKALQAENVKDMRRSNHEFHMTMYGAADSPLLLNLIESLLARSPYDSLWVQPDRAAKSVTEHDRILAALRAGDPDWAEQETLRHIRSVGEFLIAYMSVDSGQV